MVSLKWGTRACKSSMKQMKSDLFTDCKTRRLAINKKFPKIEIYQKFIEYSELINYLQLALVYLKF